MVYVKNICILFFVLLATAATLVVGQGTSVGFYSQTCGNVESIVQSTVQSHFNSDPTIAPNLLRMHFHDCFIRGCDASILIDGSNTEKNAPPNANIRGYEVIDDAKTQLEAVCPGVVSCADILALAARDSVVVTGGTSWNVPTGRRDGNVSVGSETSTLPFFMDSVDVQIQEFDDKGLNTQDLVVLVGGGHTIGTSACSSFSYRLYNFSSTGSPDPSMDPTFVTQLQSLCPQNSGGATRVGLDTGSSDQFDTSYFTNLINNRGLLESDQKLWTDSTTSDFVQSFSQSSSTFNTEFGRSMVKMSNIEVKTGSDGEIRSVCSRIN